MEVNLNYPKKQIDGYWIVVNLSLIYLNPINQHLRKGNIVLLCTLYI